MKRSVFLRKAVLISTGSLLCANLSEGAAINKNRPSAIEGPLSDLLVDSYGRPIRSKKEWEINRKIIEHRWLNYLGPLPANSNTPKLTNLKEDRPEGLVRQLVEYEGEPGIVVQGYLIRPQHIRNHLPGVVVLHSSINDPLAHISGIESDKVIPLGLTIAQLGFVTFSPICFLWHDKGDDITYEIRTNQFKERFPKSKGMAKMLFDAKSAVDVLCSLRFVNRKRIAAVGHSLGGKEVLYLGAFDKRVKVLISNEGGIGIDFSNWHAPWYLNSEIHSFGHAHHEVLSLNAPKPFLLIGGESADGAKSQAYIQAVKPVYELYKKENNLSFMNHKSGHDISPQAERWMYNWLTTHLNR